MNNLFIFIILFLFYFNLNLIYGDMRCVIYISNNVDSNSNITCGTNMTSNACQSLDQGIQACINQSLVLDMTFEFDVGTYQLNTFEPIYFYNQSITLNGNANGGTIFDLSNLNSTVFIIDENNGYLNTSSNDETTIMINDIVFQNYSPNSNQFKNPSLFNGIIVQSKLDIYVSTSGFNNISLPGTLFNLGQQVQPIINNPRITKTNTIGISLNFYLSNFTNIDSLIGGILYSTGLVTSNFSTCLFSNPKTLQSNLIFISDESIFNIENSIFSSTIIPSSNGLITVLSSTSTFSTITNSTFTDIYPSTGSIDTSIPSIINVESGKLKIESSTFTTNGVTTLKSIGENSMLLFTNNKISNNPLSSPIIANFNQSQLIIDSCTFSGNQFLEAGLYFLTSSYSKLSIISSEFDSNIGNLFQSEFSIMYFESCLFTNNKEDYVLSCLATNITITGTAMPTLYNTSTINCESDCKFFSESDKYSCPAPFHTPTSDPDSNKHKKEFIIIFVSVSLVVIIVFIILLIIAYRAYKNNYLRSGYQPIGINNNNNITNNNNNNKHYDYQIYI